MKPPAQSLLKPPSSSQQNASNLKQPTNLKQKIGVGIQNMLKKAQQQHLQQPPTPQSTSGQLTQNIPNFGAAAQQVFQIGGSTNNTPQHKLPAQLQLQVSKIIGCTSRKEGEFAFISDAIVVYTAGSHIVFYDFKKNTQVLIYQNMNSSKAYRALMYDPVQSKLYAGEALCKKAEVHVFHLSVMGEHVINMQLLTVLSAHRYGISSMFLLEEFLVTLGDENDRGMLVWNMNQLCLASANLVKNGIIEGLVRVQNDSKAEIKFITYGLGGHIKEWTIQRQAKGDSLFRKGEVVPKLKGKKITIQGIDQGFNLTKVIYENDIMYVMGYLSRSGGDYRAYTIIKYSYSQAQVLGQIKQPNYSSVQMMVNLNKDQLLLSGTFRRMQIVEKSTFRFRADEALNWSYPPIKGQLQMITQEIYDYLASSSPDGQEYSPLATLLIHNDQTLLQLMQDGLMNFHDIPSQTLQRALVHHSDQITDLLIKDYQPEEDVLHYITSSRDNTLRLWSTGLCETADYDKAAEGDIKRVVYMEHEEQLGRSSVIGRHPTLSEDEQGIKCMAFNSIRQHVAVGDMVGNIRVYQLSAESQQKITQINFIEAHESKVTALCYNEPFSIQGGKYLSLLVSGSTDRMIHIFNASSEDYDLIQTIDLQSSAIVDVRFSICNIGFKNQHKVTQYEKQLRIYACTSDKVLASYKYSIQEKKFIQAQQKEQSKHKIYKLLSSDQGLYLAKDQGVVELKSHETFKPLQSFQQTNQTHPTLSKATLDYTQAALSSDNMYLLLHDKQKTLQLRDARNPQHQLFKVALTETLSSFALTKDNRYLIAASLTSKNYGGGLIFVYKIVTDSQTIKQIQQTMHAQRNTEHVSMVSENIGANQDEQSAPMRQFQVREDLFDTWARSTEEQKAVKDSLEESKMAATKQQRVDIQDFVDSKLTFNDRDHEDEGDDMQFGSHSSEDLNEKSPHESTQKAHLPQGSIDTHSQLRSSLTLRFLTKNSDSLNNRDDETDSEQTQSKKKQGDVNQILQQIEALTLQLNNEGMNQGIQERMDIGAHISKIIGKLCEAQGKILSGQL